MAIASLVPGQVFAGDFVIERELAEGGKGVLYVALQRSTNKRRALKVMQPQLVSAKNPEQAVKNQQRFLAEARAAGGIDSEHIVEVVTAGIDAATGAPWMVMELLEGNDLDDELRRRTRLPPAECLSLFEQLCHALAAAHRAGVFHLDLKPENIFLARSRSARAGTTVKVLDFGIARLVSEHKRSTTVTTAIGSPFWMSPEQSQRGAKVGAYTDVWALGLIAFRALTGVHYWREANVPREEVNVTGWLMEMMTASLDPASQRAREFGVDATLSPGFDAWFARCVNRDVNARFDSASACFDALASALPSRSASPVTTQPLAQQPRAPIPPSPGPPLTPPEFVPVTPIPTAPTTGARNPATVGAAGVAGLLVLGAIAWKLARPPHENAAPHGASIATVADAGARVIAVVREPVPLRVTQVSMGLLHTCARTEDARVMCWGRNRSGQIGDGTTAERVWPTLVRGLDHVQQVVAGPNYTCALREDHTLWCWGDNSYGQLGDPTFTNSARWTPAVVPNLSEVSSVALLSDVTLVTSNGAVLGWGSPLHHLVGSTNEVVRTPTRHAGFDNAYPSYVVGASYGSWACAGMSDVTMRCWGYNGEGAFGDGTTRESVLPVRTPWRRPRSIAFGEYTTCIVTDNGEVFCFGSNGEGELGTGDTEERRTTPQRLTGLSAAVQVSGGYRNLCAVLASGEVFCWGGEVVSSQTTHIRWQSATPVRLEGLRDVTEMTGGRNRGCAIVRDHTLRCWGMNVSGVVGETTPVPTPAIVTVQPDAL